VHIRVWEEDGAHVAECIDIPGCVSQGATRSEALANILDAVTACLEVIAEDAGVSNVNASPAIAELDLPIQQFIRS
jgi:predicted RNase H-like HicB family nuclease